MRSIRAGAWPSATSDRSRHIVPPAGIRGRPSRPGSRARIRSASSALIDAARSKATGTRFTGVRKWAGALAIAAALAGPLAYSIQTLNTVHTGGVITAGPQVPGTGMPAMAGKGTGADAAPKQEDNKVPAAVVQKLTEDAQSYTWAAAVPGSTEAAYYQLDSDQPVMALGGFSSGDPAPTLEQFQTYVADGRIHY